MLSFFWLILSFNVLISIKTQWNVEYDSALNWFLNLSFPVWAAIVGGFPFGLIFFIIPQEETDFVRKMLRSQLFGVMVVTFIYFVFQLYNMMLPLFVK